MPIVALAMPAGEWRENGVILRHSDNPKEIVVLKYGDFLGTALDFFIVAFVLFILVSKLVKAAEGRFMGQTATTKPCPWCTETIPVAAKKCKFCCSDLTRPAAAV
jgi:large conductance mechanosensitive channel